MKGTMNNEIDRNGVFETIIDSLHLVEATGMSREELLKHLHKATIELNLCYVLADVIDWLMKDVEDDMRKIRVPYDDRDKSYFREMRKLIGASRKWAQRATRGIYNHEDADQFAGESDWWYNIIRLIEDRTGIDHLKTKQVLAWLTTMPSELNMFDIKMRDFRRLI